MLLDPDVRIVKTPAPTRLSWRRRRMALTVTLVGLGTFVTPLIGTDSEILGRTRWSPLQLGLALHAGTLPIAHPMSGESRISYFIDFFFGLAAIYVVLGLVAAAILFLPSVRLLRFTTIFGAGCVWGSGGKYFQSLQEAIYGSWNPFAHGSPVHAGTNFLILLGVFGLLILIVETKELE